MPSASFLAGDQPPGPVPSQSIATFSSSWQTVTGMPSRSFSPTSVAACLQQPRKGRPPAGVTVTANHHSDAASAVLRS